MNSIFNTTDYENIMQRLERLTPQSQAQWGKMDVAQMMAHCTEPIRAAFGEIKLKNNIIVMLFRGAIKKSLTSKKQFSKNSPTAREYKITDARNFEEEKKRLKDYVAKIHEAGALRFHNAVHPLVGQLTADEWGLSVYKHLDYHLDQFGV